MSVLLCLLLVRAVEPSASDVEIAPAPGASIATAIVLSGAEVPLDASGRAQIPAGVSPSGGGLRFSTIDPAGPAEILYYPDTSALASWRLPGLGASGPASVVLKEHDAETWENARTFAAPLEETAEGRRVRFAIPAGLWDAAIVVPGFAPAFVLELDVYEDDDALRVAATKLEPAARLGARVLDARTGRPPHHWKAWISRVDGPWEDEETKFFDGLPIAEDGRTLDFSSLPVGEWELRVEALENGRARGRARAAVKAARPRERVNLGDIYLSDFGSLRVAVTFPTRVPDREFACWVSRVPLGGEGQWEGLASKDFAPRAANDLVFADLEAGPVTIQCGDHKDIYDRRDATIVAGEVAEAELSFAPVRVSGSVRRGEEGVSGATVAAVLSGPDELKVEAKSDETGSYDLVVWPARESILLLTTPPEDRLPFAESLDVAAGATEIEHDVRLPSRSIRGTVRDQETGAILPGADVTFSGPLEAKGLEDGRFSMSTMSDGEGRFRLGNLLDQPLDVEVTLDGYAPSVRTGIQPTPEGTEIEVLLEKGSRLTGVVVDELGAPVSNVAVGLDVDSGGDYVQRTRTSSASGEFDFGAVASGPHLLTAFRCGSVFAFERFDVASYESDPPPRVVRLRPASAPIELQVVDENDEPVAEAGFRWSVGGLPVPMEDWAAAAQACGQNLRTNGSGMLRLYGFPPGVIGAASLDRVPLGTFPNDGTRRQWTLRLQAQVEEEQHLEAVPGSASR